MDIINICFYILVLLIGLFILGKSAHYVIIAVTRIGHNLGISQFITGYVILGVATSTPEIFVGINAAIDNIPQLSLGNLFGANIVLLTLISGVAALLNGGVNVKHELGHGGRLIQIVMLILAPLLLLLDSHLSWLDSLFLLITFVGYLLYLYHYAPRESQPVGSTLMNHKFMHTLFLFFAGLLGLILASKAVVFSATQMALLFQISPLVMGILLLAVGTNLPEISVVLAAVRKHRTNLVIGDVLGSASTNTLVIAMVGLIKPFSIDSTLSFKITAIFMVLTLAMFFIFTKSKDKLSRNEGLVLLGMYFVFLGIMLFSLRA